VSDASTSALRAHAVPLAGVDPALPDDDLVPLLERLAGARLVGLGEATHGDHESFQFRSRLVQTLVRRRGLGAVLFEAGPAEIDPFDRYVIGALDTLPTGREPAFWWTEEVRDLLVWLRAWNVGHPDAPVRVGGTTPIGARGLVLALRRLDEAGIAAPAAWRRMLDEAAPGQLRDLPWVESALAAWRATPPLDSADPHLRWIALLAETFRQALEVWSGRIPPPPPGSMEHLLDRLELNSYAVEPARVPALRDELAVRNARMVAVEGADQFQVRCVPAERFDLVVYFRETHPSRVIARS
jgi:erythromycin esterase-like protein